MMFESVEGGAYQIFVAEDNSSFYVRLLPNDAVGMDGDIPYTFYRYPSNPVSAIGGAITRYAYDRENRLTQATYPDGTKTQYQCDRRNNMASTTTITETATETTAMTYDIENRLLQSGNKTFEYDSNGNQVEGDTYYGYYSTFLDGYKVKWLGSVGTVGGGIDPGIIKSAGEENIGLSSVPADETLDDTPATTYGYALDGRRVGKAGHVNMKYLYDGENVIYELWDNKTVRFTHPVKSGGGCGSGACGAGSCDIFFTDHPISITIYNEIGEATKYYYLYDGLGSVTELIDVNENVVNVYRYTPFGDALVREETVYNPYQFTGRQYDAESGQYHYRARAYSADIGRFMQQDPAGMLDGPNMYAYVGWNPVNRVDPFGLLSFAGMCAFRWSMFFINLFFSAIGIYAKLNFIESLAYNLVTVWNWNTITAAIFKDTWRFAGVILSIFVWASQQWIKSQSWWKALASKAFMALKFVTWGTILPLIGLFINASYGLWRLRKAGCL